jgi:hypothetical protein
MNGSDKSRRCGDDSIETSATLQRSTEGRGIMSGLMKAMGGINGMGSQRGGATLGVVLWTLGRLNPARPVAFHSSDDRTQTQLQIIPE